MAHYEVRAKRIEPLWDRVDRNRVRLLVFLVVFFIAMTLGLGVIALALVLGLALVFAGGLLEFGLWLGEGTFETLLGWVLGVTAAGVALYMLRALTRDERWIARRLQAYFVERGDMLPTKYALKDMAIASGFDVAPALYVIETPNVNAFVYQRGKRRAIVGVTRGLTERLTAEEQRGVFANLMARLQQGDMLWASAVTALMAPLWHVRDRQLENQANRRLVEETWERSLTPEYAKTNVSGVEVFGAVFITLFVVISELLAYGHRSSQLRHAETADAEGMLLLKDPRSMLSALEKSVRFNNFVPTAGPAMTQLFYAWTGDCSTDDEEDPEMRRVTRLREVLGVEGMAPPVTVPNEPTFVLAPPAPRLEPDEGASEPGA